MSAFSVRIAPAAGPVPHGILQRCGPVPCNCPDREEGLLNRTVVDSTTAERQSVPPIVDEVVRSPGQPLAADVRAFFEPRFGMDFSHVRVHTDAAAAQSAKAIHALAYTVGTDVSFAAGKYTLVTMGGRELLAHELAHVVQQRGHGGPPDRLRMDDPLGPAEREAQQVGSGVMDGTPVLTPAPSQRMIQRQQPPTRTSLGKPDAGITAGKPDAGTEPPRNRQNELVADADKAAIDAYLKKTGIAADVPASVGAPAFLLHDTSSAYPPEALQKQKDRGRGPLGGGVAAYVPRTGPPELTRPRLFEARRPTTTEFEKDIEAFKKPGDDALSVSKRVQKWKDRRDELFRTVWNATDTAAQAAAADRALGGAGLTAQEKTEQIKGNKRKGEEHVVGLEAELKSGSASKVMSAASWAVEEICVRVASEGAKGVAVAGQEADLASACAQLTPYFATRRQRVESTVPVEIVQPGVKSKEGSQDTCNPKNPNIAPLAKPEVYSDQQYDSVVALYLRAAQAAGRFSRVTTHFAVDAFIQGHCDPRCFNLGELYDRIANALGHAPGSTYGIEPSYGTKWGTHNVWWDSGICHGPPPTAPKFESQPKSKPRR